MRDCYVMHESSIAKQVLDQQQFELEIVAEPGH